MGFPDMWHVAIQWSLGTDENVRGLAGIPGTTYGNRGDKSLRTGAWEGLNTLFITGKTSKSMVGLYSPSLGEAGLLWVNWKPSSSQGPGSVDIFTRVKDLASLWAVSSWVQALRSDGKHPCLSHWLGRGSREGL